MVLVFSQTTLLQNHWTDVTNAIWQKYPNPFAAHVLSSDVIDRYLDKQTSKRLSNDVSKNDLNNLLYNYKCVTCVT